MPHILQNACHTSITDKDKSLDFSDIQAMNSTKALTHDISLIDHHVKDLEAFGRTLNEAAAAAFPRDGRSRYKEVHVLLLSWEGDDLGRIRGL